MPLTSENVSSGVLPGHVSGTVGFGAALLGGGTWCFADGGTAPAPSPMPLRSLGAWPSFTAHADACRTIHGGHCRTGVHEPRELGCGRRGRACPGR